MSASQRNVDEPANKLAKLLPRAHLREYRIMAPLPQPARVPSRGHKA
ncbi:hypothetical protein CSHISOI_08785 [Colletotrichum shisoi]|uniref:Uncharacterized protein n=1 Tax=Colletotrichum shisoi TaxID=2078593 RepID=A0A5Q4BI64_9PEZI|nr:hypothetical protein CSHISOI_08785 [Colletotrichum shisoi]